MNRQILSDDFELKGLWWLPESPERSVPGTVSFDHDGISLELFGTLREPTVSSNEIDPSIILGMAQGSLVTLHDALATEYPAPYSDVELRESSPHLGRSVFQVHHLFIGVHFGSEDELRFASLDVSFTHLEEWIGPEHFPFRVEGSSRGHTVTHSHPEPTRMRVRALESEISIEATFNRTSSELRIMRLEHNAIVTISPDEQRDLVWYLSALRDCQNLLTLLVGRPVHPRWVTAHVEGEYRNFTTYGTIQGSVEIFSYEHSRPLRIESSPPWYWTWRHVLVPWDSVNDSLERIFSVWFDRAGYLRAAYTLFFSTLYAPEMYVTSEFLNLAQTLEIFHRRTVPKGHDKYFPKEKYREYRQAMLSVLPDSARAILENRLQFLNEYSLKERLEDLAKRVPYTSRTLISTDMDDFIKRVRDTRNYLTHYTTRKKAFADEEYLGANARLRLWLIIMFLLELGVDHEIVLEASTKFRSLNIPAETYTKS